MSELYSDYDIVDILASIRKYGVYMTDEAIEKILSDPEYRVNLIEKLKEEWDEQLKRKNEEKAARANNEQKDMLIFENNQLGELSTYYPYHKDNTKGYFYVLECGKQVKIGSTKDPATRLKTLYSNFTKYGNVQVGRCAISQTHSNFRENEKKLHFIFDAYRVRKTELFEIDFDTVVSNIKNSDLEYKYDEEQFSIQPFLDIAVFLSECRHTR